MVDLSKKFKNQNLLVEALTHRSYLNEHPEYTGGHNERLEFLGDAILEMVITAFLFSKFTNQSEGVLTEYRAALVNTQSLAEAGKDLNIRMSKGESKNTGRARTTLLADAFEAVIGAIYLDQGYAAAEKFIAESLYHRIDDAISYKDSKSRLQEIIQKEKGITPHYEVVLEQGFDHDKTFEVSVFAGKEILGKGTGKSKQESEQKAASSALCGY